MQENKKSYSSTFQAKNLQIRESKLLKDLPSSEQIQLKEIMSDHMFYASWSKEEGWSDPALIEYTPFLQNIDILSLNSKNSVFEGMTAYKNGTDIVLYKPREHFKNLRNSAFRMRLPDFYDWELLTCLEKLLILDKRWLLEDKNTFLYIRPVLFSTDEYLNINGSRKAILIILLSPVYDCYESTILNPISLLADSQYARGYPEGSKGINTGYNCGPSHFTKQIAESKGCSDVLWLINGYITGIEALNVFFTKRTTNRRSMVAIPSEDIIHDKLARKNMFNLINQNWKKNFLHIKHTKIEKLLKMIEEKNVLDMFATGTAGVILIITKIFYNDKWYEIPSYNTYFSDHEKIKGLVINTLRNIIKTDGAHVIQTEKKD